LAEIAAEKGEYVRPGTWKACVRWSTGLPGPRSPHTIPGVSVFIALPILSGDTHALRGCALPERASAQRL